MIIEWEKRNGESFGVDNCQSEVHFPNAARRGQELIE
jgi:hypothetical protein